MLCPITEMRSRPGVWLTYSRTSSASRLPHESMPSNVCRSRQRWCQDGRTLGAAEPPAVVRLWILLGCAMLHIPLSLLRTPLCTC